MNRALAVLTCVALVTLGIEATDDARPVLSVGLGTVFAVVAVVVFARVDRQEAARRRVLAVGYLAVQLLLGCLVFATAEAGVGATLLLMVLVARASCWWASPARRW